MNNPFDQISGQINIKGRVYSAKEVIRGLLEQGIAITESSEGLKIGFKLFSPQSASSNAISTINDSSACPFLPYMSQISARLDNLTTRLDSENEADFSPSKFSSSPVENLASSPFSPRNNPSLMPDQREEREKFFSSTDNLVENHQKCSSCAATLPQNAFFCNKCGKHARSG